MDPQFDPGRSPKQAAQSSIRHLLDHLLRGTLPNLGQAHLMMIELMWGFFKCSAKNKNTHTHIYILPVVLH